MLERIKKLQAKVMSKNKPETRIIFVETGKGETREQAQTKYERGHSLKSMSSENYIFINVPSGEQISERI